MSRGYLEDEEDNVREQVFYNHLQNSPTTSTFPRPPTDRFPRRKSLSQPQDTAQHTVRGMKRSKPPPLPPLDTRSRSNSKSNGKGKEPMVSPSLTDQVSNSDRYYGYRQNGTPSSGPSQAVSPAGKSTTADGSTANGGTRRRGSLLVAATDALSLKFGRRRASVRQPPTPVVLSDVIDIRQPLPDEEEFERSRLRDEAAQAIGLGSYIIARETQSREDSATDEDEEDGRHLHPANTGAWGHGMRNPDTSVLVGSRSRLHGSSVSVTIPVHQPPPVHAGRFRAGSVQSRSKPARTMPSVPIPPFPSTIAALMSFTQSAGEFPKYYPPSSLRIFALSKNWKSRYIVLSAPSSLVTQSRTPAVSYLHLFKTSNPEENEVERLEINEDSVVFVSEDEVGGRRQVIKIGGADVGALKKEYIHGEGGHAMWLLQMTDQAVAHLWISNIKNAILGQRTVRAGLMPHSFGNHEPRGDMDVMLSIRAQGLLTSSSSPTNPTFRSNDTSSPIPFQQPGSDPNYASSISSQSARSQTTIPRTSPANAVSVLKGLFSGRPRSSSRATSINSDRQPEATDGSFASMGNSLLGMMRSHTPDAQSINTVNTAPTMRTNLPIAEPISPITPIERRLDRPILPKPQSILWSASEPIRSISPDMTMIHPSSPAGPPSLQPPPRKRWTSSTYNDQTPNRAQLAAVSSPNTPTAESSRRISFSASVTSKERLEPPQVTGFSFGSPQQTRAASLKSVSTYASADKASNVDKSSVSTKRSSGARRWSRQGMLPSRSNPPSDPPPAIPHPYANDQKSGHGSSQSSHKSFVSALPKFAKRQSGSSVQSFASFSTTHSQPGSAISHPHPRASTSSRNSMPPPLPAPTSALPPAPADSHYDSRDDMLKSAEPLLSPSMKSNFRNSVGRNFRNSMVAPKPPPSANLPPRPDQPEYKAHHRRTLSGEGAISPSKLESIPASPVPPAKAVSPFPPPDSPLPPTPFTSPPPEVKSNAPIRTSSLKRRLRNLSAPASSSNKFNGKLNLGYPSSNPSNSGDTLPSSFLTTTTSTPPTPIAEKIATFTDEELNLHPSFLQMHTPVMPTLSLNPAAFPVDPPPEKESTGFTELPPPPRRSSKQLLDTEVLSSLGASLHKVPEPQPSTPVHTVPNYLSLSRPGSAMSHRSERTEPASELDWNDSRDEVTLEEEDDRVSPTDSNSHAARPHFSLSRPASIV
ncbi:hypothetical protein D9619_007324 [Psilocybe cf. subviscida]|uniref:PH domain-containing protein n=1 Tax=Psilocybe cf. subviscida TaxID=2480587 RepID=A0A8H5EX17_9AGAR|nr:hypothetical protein D9619_007324 [Psilocybe cf. subviscida]